MADDTKTDMIPKARLDAEIEKRKAAEERATSLQSQLTEASATAASATKEAANLKAQVDGIPGLQEQLTSMKTELDTSKSNGSAHTAMLESGIKDGSVRDFTMHQYKAHKAEAGDKAQDFKTWWAGQLKTPSAILKPFLAGDAGAGDAGAGDAGGAGAGAGGAAGTEKGVKQSPSTPSPWSPGAVTSMSKEDFKAQKAELLKSVNLRSIF